ncbi:MAG TPA: hypothetical protein EYM79_03380, partial [Planctomycetes bacterium]|nr:hypothetical protein [Planctomycetota bacterium]
MKNTLSILLLLLLVAGTRLYAQDAAQDEFKQPQAKHRTSMPVPNPWLGYGHDNSTEIQGAMYLKTPEQIRTIFLQQSKNNQTAPLSFPKSSGLRIVATGHSWMRPGFRALPTISQMAGLKQQLRINSRGGERGAVRMMWELENGILSSHGKPQPVCMAAITTGQWDAMMWGSYTNDRPEYYLAWIDYCVKYNPKMEFYVFNAWPQYADGFAKQDRKPQIENYRARAHKIDTDITKRIAILDKHYPDKVHVLPTCEAMMGALELYFKGTLPGIKGLNRKIDGATPAIWSDGGHLGVGMDWLEGYVFYATLYKKSPELIPTKPPFNNDALDRVLRK